MTIDDLPYQTRWGGDPIEPDADAREAANQAILAALGTVPATVFVNCGNLTPDDTLVARWRAAGHSIGNHTAHHSGAAKGDLDDWVADVRACDGLWDEGSSEPRWFRFPYLWRGETMERRDAVLGALEEGGYRTVPVTADSHDWLFEAFRRKVDAEDTETLSALGDRFVRNVLDAVAEGRQVGRAKLGREVPQILLLHVNHTTAASLPGILEGLDRQGIAVVPLSDVLADPLYAEPDAWAGKGSRMWPERTAPTQRPDGSDWYTERESELRAELKALSAIE